MLQVEPDVVERGLGSFEAICNADPNDNLSWGQPKMPVGQDTRSLPGEMRQRRTNPSQQNTDVHAQLCFRPSGSKLRDRRAGVWFCATA